MYCSEAAAARACLWRWAMRWQNPESAPIMSPSSGVHLTLPDFYSPEFTGLIVPKTKDGRVVFMLPWLGAPTVLATTAAATATVGQGCEAIAWSAPRHPHRRLRTIAPAPCLDGLGVSTLAPHKSRHYRTAQRSHAHLVRAH